MFFFFFYSTQALDSIVNTLFLTSYFSLSPLSFFSPLTFPPTTIMRLQFLLFRCSFVLFLICSIFFIISSHRPRPRHPTTFFISLLLSHSHVSSPRAFVQPFLLSLIPTIYSKIYIQFSMSVLFKVLMTSLISFL